MLSYKYLEQTNCSAPGAEMTKSHQTPSSLLGFSVTLRNLIIAQLFHPVSENIHSRCPVSVTRMYIYESPIMSMLQNIIYVHFMQTI